LTNEPTTQAPKRSDRLSSGPQLWCLNRAGWLELRETPDPNDQISSQHADLAIRKSIEGAAE
jgi:hypothetical protein